MRTSASVARIARQKNEKLTRSSSTNAPDACPEAEPSNRNVKELEAERALPLLKMDVQTPFDALRSIEKVTAKFFDASNNDELGSTTELCVSNKARRNGASELGFKTDTEVTDSALSKVISSLSRKQNRSMSTAANETLTNLRQRWTVLAAETIPFVASNAVEERAGCGADRDDAIQDGTRPDVARQKATRC